MKPISLLPFLLGFTALFTCYHAAEYMVLYMNSSIGFLGLSTLFFVIAFAVARWQGYQGLSAWGMVFKKSNFIFLLAGLLAGLAVNTLAYLSSMALNQEMVSFIPPVQQFIPQASLLIFGCAFSSLTEDVLTRGYLYRHLTGRVSTGLLVLISALVYVLNHIHRLDEPVYLLFLFIVGIQLMIPFVICKNIWYTMGIHWAGNIVYHDFHKLVVVLYRVDVSEPKLKKLLQANPQTDAAVIIADLLIERQVEKIKTRESFRGKNDIPEDEKW